MPRTIYRERFANLLKGELSATFRKEGFKRKGQNFFREYPYAWQVVNFQNFTWNTATWGEFVINIGIDLKSPEKTPRSQFPLEYECDLRERMGEFLDMGDCSFVISDDDDVDRVRKKLITIFQKYIFPFLNMFTSEDRIIQFLREDVCYCNDIYAGQDFFSHMIKICKKQGETELGLRLVEDRQALLDVKDDKSETVKRHRAWLESQKKDLLGESSTPAAPTPGNGIAGDGENTRYCTADPTAEIINLVDRMTVAEDYSNSLDSIAWGAYRDAETLADERYIPVLKELVLAETEKNRRDALYFILGKLGERLGSSEAVSFLIERLPAENDKDILRNLLEKIAAIPKDSSVDMEAVIRLADDVRWEVGPTAIIALNKPADQAVEDKLIEICGSDRDNDDIVRANSRLDEIGTPRAIPVLEKHLKSRSRRVRRSAECALDAIKKRQNDEKTALENRS